MSRRYFFNVCAGRFSERPEPGQLTHSTQDITGHLVKIVFKETTHGEVMRLHMVDDNNFYVISMFVQSRAATAFSNIINNIDLKEEIKLALRVIEGKDFFNIEQFGSWVPWYYKNEKADMLPIGYEDRRRFFISMIEKDIIPILAELPNPRPGNRAYKPIKTNGIHGGYFDGHASNARVVGPVSRFEKQDNAGSFGKNRTSY